RWFFNRWTLIALPIAAAIYFAPFAVSMRQAGVHDGLSLVYRENLQRFLSPHNHKGPAYLYAGVMFVLAAPWSLLLPAALVSPRRATPGDRLVRAYFIAIFAFFTLAASRRSYYLLPVLPASSLMIARLVLAAPDGLRPIARRLRNTGVGLFAILVVLSG